MNLNKNEKAALIALVRSCLDAMGGKHPSDLWNDFYAWVEPRDLVAYSNFTINQAKGYFSDFEKKGLVMEHEPGEWCLTESAVKLAERVWQE